MLLETILCKTQPALKVSLQRELKRLRYKPVSRPGFLYATGTIPVLLVAHLDTVHKDPVRTICKSADENILMSPEGIGGDDRAGVYMILRLLRKVHCHVLFCEDEECGGFGAEAFVRSGIKPDVNYIVELDRHGSNDAVFYDCANLEFTEYICSFGFVENFGSFSDISVIAPSLGIAAVNISSGYHNEHTKHEYINLVEVERNIRTIERMLLTPTDWFKYVPSCWGYPRYLSLLPYDAYVRSPNGDMHENCGEYLIDESGAVYEGYEDGTAWELHGFTAYTKDNLPARYDEATSFLVEVQEV